MPSDSLEYVKETELYKLKDILNEEELYILAHSIGYYCKKMNPKEMMIIINKNKTVPYTGKDILKIYKNT